MNAPLVIVTVAMLIQQSLSYMSQQVLPNMAPVVAASIDIDVANVGYYTSLIYLASCIWQLSCGPFILRYGALRMSQVSLIVMAVGLSIGASGLFVVIALGALVIGSGTAFSTPSSSHLLARYAPPRYAPLIFSVKQTGVPVGGLLAGTLVPLTLAFYSWQAAFLGAAAVCLTVAIALQPYRARFDEDRHPATSLRPTAVISNLRIVMSDSQLRDMAFAMFTFVGLQGLFGSYFVTLLTQNLGRQIETANHTFSIAMATAIFARIFWGWVGSTFVRARLMLALLAFTMAAASAATGLYEATWTDSAIVAVAILYCCSAISWHGLFLSEVARLAPAGMVGPVTGGVLAFGGAGMMFYPFAYAILLGQTGRYDIGFYIAAVPAFCMGLRLLKRPPVPSPESLEPEAISP